MILIRPTVDVQNMFFFCFVFFVSLVLSHSMTVSDCRFGVSPVNYPDPDPDESCVYFNTFHFFLTN